VPSTTEPILIRSAPFTAVRAFYEATQRHDADLPKQPAELARLAAAHHRTLQLPLPLPPDATAIHYRSALTQALVIATLWDLHCRPLFQESHGAAATLSMLYHAMVQRLALNAHKDPSFTSLDPRPKLENHYWRLIPLLTSGLASFHLLPTDTGTTADYLNYLAFTVWRPPSRAHG
jgi:hypothetical protein